MPVSHKLKHNTFFLSLLGGILLSLSFTSYFFISVFIALVPLFFMAYQYFIGRISAIRFITLTWLSFLIWNALTTWWISLASVGGALMAIVANSIIMCMVFTLPFLLQKKIKYTFNLWWLVPFWMSFEYLHFHWDLMWPWLTLGNTMAFAPYLAQWYEITGTSGGTLWILSLNIVLYNALSLSPFEKGGKGDLHNSLPFILKNFRTFITLLFVPIIISVSLWIYRQKEMMNNHSSYLNVLIVQPNIDPYNEKFYVEPLTQINKAYQLIKNQLNDSIDVILLPETFITENIYESTSKEMLQHSSLKFLQDSILMKYPELTIITGANTFKFYANNDDIPATARMNSDGMYYDIFNTALCIYKDSVQIFHKSKLVPGVEKMPYPALFKPLEKLAIDLGGTTGSLGRQTHPSLLYVKNKIPVATVICYESVFSDFVSNFFKLNASALFIITNDGWWGSTPGYYQHLLFGRLRAIENRTYIARSANTGVSAVINPLGEIVQSASFWTEEILLAKIPLIQNKTIYSQTGDIISVINILILVYILIFKIILRKWILNNK